MIHILAYRVTGNAVFVALLEWMVQYLNKSIFITRYYKPTAKINKSIFDNDHNESNELYALSIITQQISNT